jgi:predicted amidohydrolase
MKVALAQLNSTVGDFAGNEAAILAAYRRGIAARASIVVCPELCVTGYPPRDLLLKRLFVARNIEVLNRLAAGPRGTPPVAAGDQFRRAVAARQDRGHASKVSPAHL